MGDLGLKKIVNENAHQLGDAVGHNMIGITELLKSLRRAERAEKAESRRIKQLRSLPVSSGMRLEIVQGEGQGSKAGPSSDHLSIASPQSDLEKA